MTSTAWKQIPDRLTLVATLRTLFPYLAEESQISPVRGGRAAALEILAKVKPLTYRETRNFLSGDVTRLSPYLRHGVLTLAEVRDTILQKAEIPEHAGKLVNELAWRDYWQRLYVMLGEAIWEDQEPYKTGLSADQYAPVLPDEIPSGQTTLACMDSFARDLEQTGYLHNHVRLWFASYIVHWRRVRWQAGARWFLEHLIDGDPASNNLSWQWVASTFSSAPYIFNRENLERFTEGEYCRACPHATQGTCPFEQSYDALEMELFPKMPSFAGLDGPIRPRPYAQASTTPDLQLPGSRPLKWHHTDSLNPSASWLLPYVDTSSVFVWDTGWLVPNRISLKRVLFLAECLQEMPASVELRVGEPADELLDAARFARADHILAQRTPDPRLCAAAAVVNRQIPVVWVDVPAFVPSSRGFDLKRFSRYWKRAQESALQPTQNVDSNTRGAS